MMPTTEVDLDRPNPAPRLFAASPWLTAAALVMIFAAGLVVAHGTFNIIDVGVPVALSGVRVQPGDLVLLGDADGGIDQQAFFSERSCGHNLTSSR